MHYDIRWVYATALLSLAGWVQAAPPAGWADTNFGFDNYGGDSLEAAWALDGTATNITVKGQGDDLYGGWDTGRLCALPLAGDCEIVATVPPIPAGGAFGEWARVGVMMRGSPVNNAANMTIFRNLGNQVDGSASLLVFQYRQNDGWGYDTGYSAVFAPGVDERMRIVRQGDLFTAWVSTNAPAYDQWIKLAERTQTFGAAIYAGLVVSRWWNSPTAILPLTFNQVKSRTLVTATVAEPNVSVDWIGDPAIESGTIVGYAVERAVSSGGTFAALGDTAAGVVSYSDATASQGVSYLYRVYAKVDVGGGVTNSVLVGTSLAARLGLVLPAVAPNQGLAAEYYQPKSPLTLVGARVDPNIENPWFATGYPASALSGLTGGGDPDNYRAYWTGTIMAPESGAYGFVTSADDEIYMWVDGVQVMNQGGYQADRYFNTAPVRMEAGRRYPVRIEFAEGGGGQQVHLQWFKKDMTPVPVPQSALEPFPQPWQHRDVGESPRFGNAFYDYTAKAFTLTSGGLGINPATGRDDGHFAWQSCATDFDLAANVTSLTGPAQPGMAAGLSVRSSNADNAASVAVVVYAAGETGTDRVLALAVRETDGGVPSTATLAVLPEEEPVELRLTRRGGNMQAYYRTVSSGGWVSVTNMTTALTGTLNAGLTVFSGDTAQTATGVFDTISFFTSLGGAFNVTVADHQATVVNTAAETPMKTRQTNDALPNVEYYWADALNGDVSNYMVYRSNRPDQLGSMLGEAPAPGFTYVDPIPAVNTLYFYAMQTTYKMGELAGGGSNDLLVATQAFGISDGSVNGGGTGLYTEYLRERDSDHGPIALHLPAHAVVNAVTDWNKVNDATPIIDAATSQDHSAVGPDNIMMMWDGWISPPYTGYYWFQSHSDDSFGVWLNSQLIMSFWGYTPDYLTSSAVYLEAGKRVPIHVLFENGGGGAFYNLRWKTGLGYAAGFETIPASAMIPLSTQQPAPQFVAPGSGAEFGLWRNGDINTSVDRPGHVVIGGTPTAFDCKVSGAGDDIWGTVDGFHYLSLPTSENFEFEATLTFMQYANDWSKTGIMVRETLASGSRHASMVQSATQGRAFQRRITTDGDSGNYQPASVNEGSNVPPVTFKVIRRHGKTLEFYVNGTHIPWSDSNDIDISGWTPTVYVGLALTSHAGGRISEAVFQNVKLTILHNQGTMLSIQ